MSRQLTISFTSINPLITPVWRAPRMVSWLTAAAAGSAILKVGAARPEAAIASDRRQLNAVRQAAPHTI
jgi:hypothetical protein